MKKLAILGASGHGKVIADCAECAGWETIVFFDDAWPTCSNNGEWNVTGDSVLLLKSQSQFDGVIVAIGDNKTRLKKQGELQASGARLVSIVHPDAVISQYAELGAGSVVMPGAIVNVDSQLGTACIVNTGAIIDHDCVLGNGVHISPGVHLAGGVSVGECSWIGIGSSVRQQIQIGKHTVVGAGSVVVKNLPASVTAYGNPARIVDSLL